MRRCCLGVHLREWTPRVCPVSALCLPCVCVHATPCVCACTHGQTTADLPSIPKRHCALCSALSSTRRSQIGPVRALPAHLAAAWQPRYRSALTTHQRRHLISLDGISASAGDGISPAAGDGISPAAGAHTTLSRSYRTQDAVAALQTHLPNQDRPGQHSP